MKTISCLMCRLPMFVGDGQIAFYHKECRKKARKWKGSASSIVKEHLKKSDVL